MLNSLCTNNKVSIRVFLLHSELEKEDFEYLKEVLKDFQIEIISLKVDSYYLVNACLETKCGALKCIIAYYYRKCSLWK